MIVIFMMTGMVKTTVMTWWDDYDHGDDATPMVMIAPINIMMMMMVVVITMMTIMKTMTVKLMAIVMI